MKNFNCRLLFSVVAMCLSGNIRALEPENQQFGQITGQWFGLDSFAIIVFLLGLIVLLLFLLRNSKRLKANRDQLITILDTVPHMILVYGVNGKMKLCNKAACQFFGLSNREMMRFTLKKLKKQYPQSFSLFEDDSQLLNVHYGEIHRVVNCVDYTNTNNILQLYKTPLTGNEDVSAGLVTVCVDVTHSNDVEEQIQHMLHHNSLTNLPNKLLLKDRIEQSLIIANRENNNGVVFFIDVDDLKDINESLGYQIGDKLIVEIAERMESIARPGDTLEHTSGDEFVFQFSKLSDEVENAVKEAHQIGKMLLDLVAKPYDIRGEELHITCSIGMVMFPSHGNNHEQLIKRAQIAMYQAKSSGKNRLCIFNPELEIINIKRHELGSDMRTAIKQDELFLLYQPIFKGDTEHVMGAEVLMRWIHPFKGVISPDEFIPIAEANGLIKEIGFWMLDKTCCQIRKWIDEGREPIFISANISFIQVKDPHFYLKIEHLIQQYNIPPNRLELEITESVLMSDVDEVIQLFDKLKKLGIRLTIDDFGTGFSSLSYLQKIPLDKLKIDRSFIQKIPFDIDSVAIVKTIINMSRDMGLEVIAEGVENIEQLKFLKTENCEYFQGFYFEKPMVREDFEKYLGVKIEANTQ
ncbi:MAG: sensor domain-containing phosphodiesterase [Proteobacteria bacterium]|nr:sensor domain-containing phosphodiesterase [Pseudomonadota bacterium]